LGLLNNVLTLLKILPDTLEHAQQELRLQMMLTTPLIALRGYTIPEVEQAYLRAQTLCVQIGEHSRLFSVLGGLCFLHYTRGQLRTAFALAQQLLGLAQKTQERRLLLWAHYMLGLTLENQGDLHAARTHFEQSLTLYDSQEHPAVYGFVQNPGLTGLARLAWILYSLGYPDQAWKKISEALMVTRRLGHSFSLAPVLMYAAEIHYRRGEDQIANELEEELSTLAHAHGFSHWSTEGALRQAWTLARQGQRAEGLVQLRQTVSTLYTRREEIIHPYIQHRLAAAYGQAGEPEEGLRIVATALGVMQREGRILWEAHFSHLKGELILQQEGKDRETKSMKQKSATPTPHSPIPDPQSEAEACFIKSLEILRTQQARSFELRATMSLARLWQQQGKTKQAHKLLSEIYNWFTEGFDTKDLQEAKALIEELSH
jgi:predicted ATPase